VHLGGSAMGLRAAVAGGAGVAAVTSLFVKMLPLGATCRAATGEGCIPATLLADVPSGALPGAIQLTISPPASIPAGYTVSLVPAAPASATLHSAFAVAAADHAACNSGETWNTTVLRAQVCFAGEYRMRIYKLTGPTPTPSPGAGGGGRPKPSWAVTWLCAAASAWIVYCGGARLSLWYL
jgi:hypothetical protein